MGASLRDEVNPADLLEGLRRERDARPPPVLLGPVGEEFLHRQLPARRDGVDLLDLVDVAQQLRVVDGRAVQVGQDAQRVVVAAVLEQPPRRLREQQDAADQDEAEDGLEGEREAPLERVLVDEPEAVVEPGGVGGVSGWCSGRGGEGGGRRTSS